MGISNTTCIPVDKTRLLHSARNSINNDWTSVNKIHKLIYYYIIIPVYCVLCFIFKSKENSMSNINPRINTTLYYLVVNFKFTGNILHSGNIHKLITPHVLSNSWVDYLTGNDCFHDQNSTTKEIATIYVPRFFMSFRGWGGGEGGGRTDKNICAKFA